jgi:DNA-binding HxlR family transcriptional regulator
VDYELTALGRSLLVPVSALGDWALKNRGKIEEARAKFDRAAAKSSSSGVPLSLPVNSAP